MAQHQDEWRRINRKRLEGFYEKRVSRLCMDVSDRLKSDLLQRELTRSIFEIGSEDIAVRRPSMCHDCTPVVHSIKLAKLAHGNLEPEYRILVEPGGVGITVPQQVNYSLVVIDSLLQELDWSSAVNDLNAIVSIVFPQERAIVSNWWGGIWLGMSSQAEDIDLRIYMNLRHGDALSRWQRVADILSWFGDGSLEALINEWVEKVSLHAIPVGIGVVISEAQVKGLRIYFGIHEPSVNVLHSVRMDANSNQKGNDELEIISRMFTANYGMYSRQSVTVGFDFRIDSKGLLVPQIMRTKLDISCQLLQPEKKASLPSWLCSVASQFGYETGFLEVFFIDIDDFFGGCEIEFFSAGFAGELDHVTVYTKPAGYA